jgi:RecJ-like exonuclease
MLNSIDKLAQEFLEISRDKSIRIVSHHDTDGITSAAILARTFKRLDKRFSIKIVKGLEEENIMKEIARHETEILFFTDLASGSLDYFSNLKNPIFILDHHEIDKNKLNPKIRIINPHLFEEEEISGAGLAYLFAKSISKENTDLSRLAIIGMIGDRLDRTISKVYQQIISDTADLTIKKSLLLYPATRPVKRTLEYCTSVLIPGVTGSSVGVLELLRETGISADKTLFDLSDEEVSRLLTGILVRRTAMKEKEDIIGNLYLIKFFNRKEDVRELSVIVNACSRLGHSDVALAFCLENPRAREQAEEIYTEYKQQLISALNQMDKLDKIRGNGFVIINAKSDIKDTIIGTVTSILSSSLNYEEGTVLIGMAYTGDKIKVSARIVGKQGRNLKEVLERVVIDFKAQDSRVEIGGHQNAAGCLIEKQIEGPFIEALKKNLEVEVVRI